MVEKLPDLGLTKRQPWWEKNGVVLKPFQKDFYTATQTVLKDETQPESKPNEFTVVNNAKNVPKPIFTFANSGLPRYLVEQLQN
jgi:hypothetical protein